jgi:hypothetical protein
LVDYRGLGRREKGEQRRGKGEVKGEGRRERMRGRRGEERD